jgi:hypothetical protein
MEDVALGDDWTPLGEVMTLLSTLDVDLFTLDVEHIDDDVMCYDAFDDDWGLTLPLGHPFDDDLGPLMMRHDL